MNHLNTESEIVRSLRHALDTSVEIANIMHISEAELKTLLEERWNDSSHQHDLPPSAHSCAERLEERYFNGLAGP